MEIEKKWIKLCILALSIAGFYSIIIVMLRTPGFSRIFSDKSIFQTALIIHVDLSVLFWMVCFVMMLITQKLEPKFVEPINVIQNLLFISIGLIFISPFIGESTPYMNNYIPILHNLVFIIAIGIFFSSFLIISIIAVRSKNLNDIAIGTTGITAILCFAISAYKLSQISYPMDQHSFYEMLFWGGGHILQFLYCAGLIHAWYEFSNQIKTYFKLHIFLWINAITVIPLPFIQLFFTIDSYEYLTLFTHHMKIFGAIASISLIIAILISNLLTRNSNYLFSKKDNALKVLQTTALLLSILLFLFGGLIALFIDGVNVTIPAHYHGSIVGISIAYMGFIYLRVDKLFSSINYKAAITQIIIYAAGQMMHISALAFSGGYGAMRKTPGVDLPLNAKIAMGFMGVGGLIAIIAGLMFIYICYKSIFMNTEYKITAHDK